MVPSWGRSWQVEEMWDSPWPQMLGTSWWTPSYIVENHTECVINIICGYVIYQTLLVVRHHQIISSFHGLYKPSPNGRFMLGFTTLNVPYLSAHSSRASGIRHLRKWFWSRPAFWIWYIDFSTKIELWYNVVDFFVAWFWQRFEINQMLGWTVPKWIGLQSITPTSGVISVAYPLWDWSVRLPFTCDDTPTKRINCDSNFGPSSMWL